MANDDDVKKALSRQDFMARTGGPWRDPGQVTHFTIPPSLTDMPPPYDEAKARLTFTEPVLQPSGLTRGLPMEDTQALAFQKFVGSILKADNELVFRASLMKHLHYDMKADPVLRKALMERALSFWKERGTPPDRQLHTIRKDAAMTIEKAEARGGNYHRRVTNPETGKHRYYASEEEYNKRPDAHLNGTDVKKANAKKAVLSHVGSMIEGASIDSIKELLTAKHDPQHLADAIRSCVDCGDLEHDNGKLKVKKKDVVEKAEGARGGKVIGHTASGKPIYASREGYRGAGQAMHDLSGGDSPKFSVGPSPKYNQGWTAGDHKEAAAAHKTAQSKADSYYEKMKHEEHGKMAAAHEEAASTMSKQMNKSGTGEGSKGGHITGHTASGKPIYASATTKTKKTGAVVGKGTSGSRTFAGSNGMTRVHADDEMQAKHDGHVDAAYASAHTTQSHRGPDGNPAAVKEHAAKAADHFIAAAMTAPTKKAAQTLTESARKHSLLAYDGPGLPGANVHPKHAEALKTLNDSFSKSDNTTDLGAWLQKEDLAMKSMTASGNTIAKAGGPFIGPKGGKYADAAHKIPWAPEGAMYSPRASPVANTHEALDAVPHGNGVYPPDDGMEPVTGFVRNGDDWVKDITVNTKRNGDPVLIDGDYKSGLSLLDGGKKYSTAEVHAALAPHINDSQEIVHIADAHSDYASQRLIAAHSAHEAARTGKVKKSGNTTDLGAWLQKEDLAMKSMTASGNTPDLCKCGDAMKKGADGMCKACGGKLAKGGPASFPGPNLAKPPKDPAEKKIEDAQAAEADLEKGLENGDVPTPETTDINEGEGNGTNADEEASKIALQKGGLFSWMKSLDGDADDAGGVDPDEEEDEDMEKGDDEDEDDMDGLEKAGGEGSRGGHITGHTADGKPIYGDKKGGPAPKAAKPGSAADTSPIGKTSSGKDITSGHDFGKKTISGMYYGVHTDEEKKKFSDAHPGYTAQDHRDAAKAHDDANANTKNQNKKDRHYSQWAAHRKAAEEMDGVKKSTNALGDWLQKSNIPGADDTSGGKDPMSGLPEGVPTGVDQGSDVNGAMLALAGEDGSNKGAGSSPGEKGLDGVDSGKQQKLNDDDPDANTMQDGAPYITTGIPEADGNIGQGKLSKSKGVIPSRDEMTAGNRQAAAARLASQQRDVVAGVGRAAPRKAAEEQRYEGMSKSDADVERLYAGDGFYTGGLGPTLDGRGTLQKSMSCPRCGETIPSWVSRCTECGVATGGSFQKSGAEVVDNQPAIRHPGIRPHVTADLVFHGGRVKLPKV